MVANPAHGLEAGDSPSLVGAACTRHDVAARGGSKTKRDSIAEVGLRLFTRDKDALAARPNLKPVQGDMGTESTYEVTWGGCERDVFPEQIY